MDLSLFEYRVRVKCEDAKTIQWLARCFDASIVNQESSTSDKIDLQITLEKHHRDKPPQNAILKIKTDPPNALEGKRSVFPVESTALASSLILWAVCHPNNYYVFHAGAVARDGKGILLPAPPQMGKSTLTAALLRRGFDFLSDEVGAIDVRSGHLLAFGRALWLRASSIRLLGLDDSLGMLLDGGDTRVVSPSELGANIARELVLPSLIICPRFKASAASNLDKIRLGQSVIELMRCSCSQSYFKVRGLDFVINLTRRVPCYRLVFCDLEEAVDLVIKAFEQEREELF